MGRISVLSIIFVTVIFVTLPMFVNVQKFIGLNEGAAFDLPGRPHVPGYHFHPYVDSSGNNIIKRGGLANNPQRLKAACNSTPRCTAFNTNGWLKHNVKPMEEWSNWTANSSKGLYIRNGPGHRAEDVAMRGGNSRSFAGGRC